VKFEVLTAVNMSVLFWAVTPCGLVCTYQRFGEISGFRDGFALMMEAGSYSETSFSFCLTTRRNVTEDGHLHGDNMFAVTLLSTYHSTWHQNPEERRRLL
jgi:hypothetical protein